MFEPYERRQTFLYRHIDKVLSGTRDVLALEELEHRAQGTALTLTGFFYGLPDLMLYDPVQVRPHLESDQDLATAYLQSVLPGKSAWEWPKLDLTYFLLALDHAHDPGGVLLNARSGAGKTVACLAAFCDCFHGPGPQGCLTHRGPRLPGRLPCRLPVDGDVPFYKPIRDRLNAVPDDREREKELLATLQTADETLIEQLLLVAAGLSFDHLDRLRSWLKHGPPLLLFFDLNTAGEPQRQLVAAALVKFQQHPEYRRAGHRCIVTYRSAVRDAVVARLEHSGVFHVCDMDPLSSLQAERYLSNFRRYEAQLTGRPCPEDQLKQELARLRELIARYTLDRQVLISTPLLMHLVSILTGQELARVQTLADLYAYVVRRFYRRDYEEAHPGIHKPESLTATKGGDPYERFLTAMVRVALAMLAGGAGNTRLVGQGDLSSDRVLNNLWGRPGVPLVRHGEPWHPVQDLEFWQVGPYFGDGKYSFGESEISVLKQLTLLHRDEDGYRFLHDSFVYYFAALAVRGWATPIREDPANDLKGENHAWYAAATRRLHADPLVWQEAAAFLGGMLESNELRALVITVLTSAPKDSWPEILQRLVRGRRQVESDDAVLAGVQRALTFKVPGVFTPETASALVGEVYHYLRDGAGLPEEDLRWLDKLRDAMLSTGHPWLRARGETIWPQAALRAHPVRVITVAILDKYRTVSGGKMDT